MEKHGKILFGISTIDSPGRKRSFVMNVTAQHIELKGIACLKANKQTQYLLNSNVSLPHLQYL